MFEKEEILKILNNNYPMTFFNAELYREGGSVSYILTTNENKYFLKVIRPELMGTALQSMDIHLFLQTNSFPVPGIKFTNDDQPYIKNTHDNKTNLFVLYEYIQGGEPGINDVEKAGELIGQLHKLMKHYPNELKIQDKYFFIERYVNILKSKAHHKAEIYKQYGDRLWEKVESLPRGYCHCDLYRGNILKADDGSMYVLDFDTSCNAFPMYDITLFCNETNFFEYSDKDFEKSRLWLRHFLNGYLKNCTLTEKEIEAYYYFQAIYHYQLQATIVEIYGIDCNENDFEDKQLDWIENWLNKAKEVEGVSLL